MMARNRTPLLSWLLIAVMLVFIYLPVIVLVLFSFQSEPRDRYHSRIFRRTIEIAETPRRD